MDRSGDCWLSGLIVFFILIIWQRQVNSGNSLESYAFSSAANINDKFLIREANQPGKTRLIAGFLGHCSALSW